MTDQNKLTWQQQGEPDEWVFGVSVRGVVRNILAEIYFDGDQNPSWLWIVYKDDQTANRGRESSFCAAIESAETELRFNDLLPWEDGSNDRP